MRRLGACLVPEVVGRRASAERRQLRSVLLVAGIMYAVLAGLFTLGHLGVQPENADLRLITVGFGAWLTLLVLIAVLVSLHRIRGYRAELDAARTGAAPTCVRVRTRLKTLWTVGDAEEDGPFEIQHMRARGVRGLLHAPLAYHRSFGDPREADIVLTKRSRLLLEVDGEPIWPEDDAG